MKIPKQNLPKGLYFGPAQECECDDGSSSPTGGNLYDRIWEAHLQKKEIIINEPITEALIEKAVIQIFNINEADDEAEASMKNYERHPIKIFINTPGGLMDEAMSLVSAIESSRTPVATLALGKAWSAGFLILLAGHLRMCQKYTSLMYHQGSAGINTAEFKTHAEYTKYWMSCQSKVEDYVKRKTKVPKKKLDQVFNGKEDWYISPEEALELKIVDRII